MMLISILAAALGTGQLVSAQGFVANCSWQVGVLADSFLGMYCHDDDWERFNYDWTWLDTNACLTNHGGMLYPRGAGNYWPTCGNCSVRGSHVEFLLSCDCLNTGGHFTPATYDLNRVVWNHNGSLGCFNYVGNKTDRGPL
ncbi:uncharacterized protein GGS25DRAFT_485990 [Hypoxylon fragiforme]|uniref:uncharacterized protein n=1 Tax=Hypoxylon fragiforme TaxID=63214 RepID=UPI0020C608E6|nr:uncharacterized protein GGS25DRAFT_485990 [Hypoxylon fragiforme]KAI2609733.1 hypothetical protein GGS25DRAFT_485990 [Hypoxylon fragiforme]